MNEEIDDKYVAANSDEDLLPGETSTDWHDYIKWLNDSKQSRHKEHLFRDKGGFTNNEHRFGEFLMKHKNQLLKVGNFIPIFKSIRSYLKQQ